MSGALAGTNLSGLLNCTTEKQQFFRDRGFTGVRMTDNGKGAAFFYFFLVEQLHLV